MLLLLFYTIYLNISVFINRFFSSGHSTFSIPTTWSHRLCFSSSEYWASSTSWPTSLLDNLSNKFNFLQQTKMMLLYLKDECLTLLPKYSTQLIPLNKNTMKIRIEIFNELVNRYFLENILFECTIKPFLFHSVQ